MKLPLLFFALLMAVCARAQTTTAIPPHVSRTLTYQYVNMTPTLWIDHDGTAHFVQYDGYTCYSLTTFSYSLSGPLPTYYNRTTPSFQFHAICDDAVRRFEIYESGYAAYSTGGGGRAGGSSGVYYHTQSGTITETIF